jgi:hypothetical protein
MSGSGPGSLGSNSQTNSFSYRNSQAYFPFYLQQKGNSFYGLSKPQYSSTTYNALACQGGSNGSNSRVGRWHRSTNTPIPPFIPPTPIPEPPIPKETIVFSNSDFGLSIYPSQNPKPTVFLSPNTSEEISGQTGPYSYTLPEWELSTFAGPTITATGTSNGYNLINLEGPNGTGIATTSNYVCQIIQNAPGKIYSNKTYKISIQCSASITSSDVGLGFFIRDALDPDIFDTSVEYNLSQNNSNTIDFYYIPPLNLTNPQIIFYLVNNDSNSQSVNISKPYIEVII